MASHLFLDFKNVKSGKVIVRCNDYFCCNDALDIVRPAQQAYPMVYVELCVAPFPVALQVQATKSASFITVSVGVGVEGIERNLPQRI